MAAADLCPALFTTHPAVVNILTLIFLLRFWPVPGGRSPLGGVEPITVQARTWGVFRCGCA